MVYIHELGHYIVAKVLGIKIIEVHLIPEIVRGRIGIYLVTDSPSNYTPTIYIIFKLGGLILTLLLGLVIYRVSNTEWLIHHAKLWIMASPIIATLDLIDVGIIINNIMLGVVLSIACTLIGVIFLFKFYRGESVF